MSTMTVKVTVETETWEVRAPDPTDPWDAGVTEGRVSWVSAEASTEAADEDRSFYGVGHVPAIFGCDAVEGETVFVVVADYSSGSTFGSWGGYFHILAVTKSYEEAMGLAQAAEAVTSGQFEFEYNGTKYYAPWTGYFENLNGVRVWDCFLRPRLD